jgi:hypothetical protein
MAEPKDCGFAFLTDNFTDSAAVTDAVSQLGELVELRDERFLVGKARLELRPQCFAYDGFLKLPAGQNIPTFK